MNVFLRYLFPTCSVSWTPSFLLKRYVLTGIRDGLHEPFIADSVDFVVSQVCFREQHDYFSLLGFLLLTLRYGALRIFCSFKRKTVCYKKEIAVVIWGHMWKSFQVETLSRDELASRLTLTVDSASVKPLLLSDSFITIMDVSSLKLAFYRLCTLMYLKYACRFWETKFPC